MDNKDKPTKVYTNADRNDDIENGRVPQFVNASPSNEAISNKSGNKNALRHGVYVHGLFPWESPKEFEALHKSFIEDCKPEGALQEQAVLTLTQWTWKRRRVVQGSQISLYRSPIPESLKSGHVTWDDVIQHQSTVPEQTEALLSSQIKLVEKLRCLSDKIGSHFFWTNTSEGKEIQLQLAKMRSEVSTLASDVREQAFNENKNLCTRVGEITTLFDQAYQPDEIEKQAKLLSMIDREIDKAVKRIIFLKTFRSVQAAEVRNVGAVNSPPVIPNETEDASTPLRGTPTRPVALAAPEHRGKPKVD